MVVLTVETKDEGKVQLLNGFQWKLERNWNAHIF